MPTVEELERLGALLARLAPLGDKQRGELIEAADWNALTGAVIEVARVVLAEDRGDAVAAHTHPDQVGVGWLDSSLRTLVQRGPLADPAAVARLAATERQLARLGTRFGDLADRVGEVRTRVTDVATKDLLRSTELERVARRVDGVGDARDDVRDLRETLRVLDVDVRRAVEVGQQLDVDGRPFDAHDVVSRLRSVEALREAWTAADGTLVDAPELERRLAEVRASTVTRDVLDTAIDGIVVALDPEDRTALLDAARVSARDEVTGSVEALTQDLRRDLDGRIADVQRRLTGEIEEHTSVLAVQVLEQASDRAAQVADGRVDQLAGELRAHVVAQVDELRGSLDESLTSFEGSLRGLVAEHVGDQVAGTVAQLETSLAALQDQIGRLDGRVTETGSAVGQLGNRVEVVRREALEAASAVNGELVSRIERLEQRPFLDPSSPAVVDALVDAARPRLREDLDSRVRTVSDRLAGDLARTVREAVEIEVTSTSTSLEGRVRGMVQDELEVATSQIDGAVAERVEAATARIPGLVAQEVERSSGQFRRVVETEVQRLTPEITRIVDRRIEQIGR